MIVHVVAEQMNVRTTSPGTVEGVDPVSSVLKAISSHYKNPICLLRN
jgi:hypothetical protein